MKEQDEEQKQDPDNEEDQEQDQDGDHDHDQEQEQERVDNLTTDQGRNITETLRKFEENREVTTKGSRQKRKEIYTPDFF